MAVERLVTGDEFRIRLQRQAAMDVCRFHPRLAAFNILNFLFGRRAVDDMNLMLAGNHLPSSQNKEATNDEDDKRSEQLGGIENPL